TSVFSLLFVFFLFFPLLLPPPPRSLLFPYTTLFRSPVRRVLLSPSWWKASKIDARSSEAMPVPVSVTSIVTRPGSAPGRADTERSEEHTSELQSRFDLVCRLLLEKKKKKIRSSQSE